MSSVPNAGGGELFDADAAVVGPAVESKPVVLDRPRARNRDVAAVVEVRDVARVGDEITDLLGGDT